MEHDGPDKQAAKSPARARPAPAPGAAVVPLDHGLDGDVVGALADRLGNRGLARFEREHARPLAISRPGDAHEREATRAAEQLTSDSPSPSSSPPIALTSWRPAGGGEGALDGGSGGGAAIGGGAALGDGARKYFEPRLGRELGDVRVHTDSEAARAARSLGAQAFTHGRDIFFAEGRYQPDGADGRRLLAHELAHTVQQAEAPRGIQRQETPGASLTCAPPPSSSAPLECAPPPTTATAPLMSTQPPPTTASATPPTTSATAGSTAEPPETLMSLPPAPAPPAPLMSVQPPPMSMMPGSSPQPASEAELSQLPPEVRRQLFYATTVLRRVPAVAPSVQQRLNEIIAATPLYEMIRQRDEKRGRLELLRQSLIELPQRNAALARGEELSGGTGASPELLADISREIDRLPGEIELLDREIQSQLQTLGVADEASLLRMIDVEFPPIWMRRAKQIAYSILDENAARVRAEAARYPGNMSTPDQVGLREADSQLDGLAHAQRDRQSHLEQKQDERRQAEDSRAQGQRDVEGQQQGGLSGGVAPSGAEMQAREERVRAIDAELDALNLELSQHQEDVAHARERLGRSFPILMSPSYTPGALAHLDDAQLAQLTGSWSGDILSNINETRENIANDRIRVWHLRDIPAMTYQDLNVREDSVLGRAVHEHIRGLESDEHALAAARQVFEFLLIALATIVTLPEGGWGGIAVGAVLTTGHLVEHIQEYGRESAAEHVALDPLVADISINEPNLLPIVLDIISLGLDAAMLGALRPAASALAAGGELADFAAEVRRLVPGPTGERIIANAERRLAQSAAAGERAIAELPPELFSRGARLIHTSREQAMRELLEEARQANVLIDSSADAEAYLDAAARRYGGNPADYHAVTIGDVIMVRPQYVENVRVLREELIHVFQQQGGMAVSDVVAQEIEARLMMIARRHQWGITNEEVREMIVEVRRMRETGVY